jgi:nicotinamidase-related amidase
MPNTLFSPKTSVLVVIDVQGKLAYLMHDKDKLFRHLEALIKAAQYLDIPIIFTEQVPEKIGSTVPEIARLFPTQTPIIKETFSCCGSSEFNSALAKLKRKQIVICGIETHVCVYQTVADLTRQKFELQVVADAVSSRREENKNIALARMAYLGVDLTSTEMLATELLRTSKHPKFKEVLKLIR